MVTAQRPFRRKAYSYIRMSTEIQLKGDSLRRQMEASRRYADTHGLDLDQEFNLHDIGVSGFHGRNIEKGNFGKFLDAVRSGQIERGSYFLVESFDRMSRQEPIRALQPFMDIVTAGIVLVTLDDERVFEGKISFEDLIISIAKMSRANEESARKSDRGSKVWQNKRADAPYKKLTARCPSWLRLSADRQSFEIVEHHAAVVRGMFDDAVAGLGTFSIVRQLNERGVPTLTGRTGWQMSTVNKILSSPAVIGTFQPGRKQNGERMPDGPPIAGYFPAILSEETFYTAQRARLERRTTPSEERKGSGGRKGKYFSNLFSKLAICAYCKEPMHFLNKGKPPKGGTYLVCSTAHRKLDCVMSGLWRYDHFEKAFLSFVEKLDLATIISSEQALNRRTSVVNQLAAVEGKLKVAEHERERTFETFIKVADSSSDFLAGKLRTYEAVINGLKADLGELTKDLATIDQTALTYYESSDQMAGLIEQVRSSRGPEVYKIRAKIASRLQALIKDVQLLIPLTDDDDEQQFEVSFRDGAMLMIFVDAASPGKILRQVRGDGSKLSIKSANNGPVEVPLDKPARDEAGQD